MVPPFATTVAEPLEPPLIVTFAVFDAVAVNTLGSVITTELVDVAPFASVTVTLYVPAVNPVIVEVVEPFDQLNV